MNALVIELRKYLAEKLLTLAFWVMPESREKVLLETSLKSYYKKTLASLVRGIKR